MSSRENVFFLKCFFHVFNIGYKTCFNVFYSHIDVFYNYANNFVT